MNSRKIILLAIALVAGAMTVSADLASWQKSRKLKGAYGEGCGEEVQGICELSCGKANKRGYAKVSLKITPFTGKKISYGSTSVYVGGSGSVTANFKGRYSVTFESDGSFFGEPIYGNERPLCFPDAVWSADVGGNLPDGVYYLKAGLDYESEFEAFDCDQWGRDQYFSGLFQDGNYCLHGGLLEPFSSDGQRGWVSGNKFNFGKSVSMKLRPYLTSYGNWDGQLIYSNDSDNLSCMKVTYNARTGIFKGSFYVYTDPYVCVYYPYNPRYTKLRKYKITLNGAFVGGEGVGFASCKRPAAGPWPVSITCAPWW